MAATLSSGSKPILENLRLILQKIGVHGKVKTEHRTYKSGLCKGSTGTLHKLEIADAASLERFFGEIGEVPSKEENSRKVLASARKMDYRRYRESKNWRYVTIKSIAKVGREETYDITVANQHNFFANGVCVHNTGKTFLLGVWVAATALRDPNAQILIVTPNESHVKVLFEDYIRPLFRVYRHQHSGREPGIPDDPSLVEEGKADFALKSDTKKPQAIEVVGSGGHHVRIRGMVISDSARGQSATHVVIDEADYAPSETLQEVVTPIFMTTPDVRALMSSTPTGRTDTYYYQSCHSEDWEENHKTFKVLPHYDQDMHEKFAREVGGEDTNRFKREFLAQWGEPTEGVFDATALRRCYHAAPYCYVMEDGPPTAGPGKSRDPRLAGEDTAGSFQSAWEGVRRAKSSSGQLGGVSLFEAALRGNGRVVTGTDWNDHAGMQTVITWYPEDPSAVEMARFEYEDDRVLTSSIEKIKGRPRAFQMGAQNGPAGGPHDLSNAEGVVIWHGRLESGGSSLDWPAAANRVASILAIPDFVDAWYVDKGYGVQVHQMILSIMESGQYLPDGPGGMVSKAQDIPRRLLQNIRQFHPDKDNRKIYRPIRFGERYDHSDFDYSKGEGRYKDVMVSLARQAVTQKRVLLPYGALGGRSTGGEDLITPTGGRAKTDAQDAGLITDMLNWREKSRTVTGRPRYEGDDHSIDGFMLSLLAYEENFAPAREGSMFTFGPEGPTADVAPELPGSGRIHRSVRTRRSSERGERVDLPGGAEMKKYHDAEGPLAAIRRGKKPGDVGTTMGQLWESVFG